MNSNFFFINFFSDLIHVKFGRIQGMSTRKGEVVFLEDLLDEAKERALKSMMGTESKLNLYLKF